MEDTIQTTWECAAGGKRMFVRCVTIVTAYEVRQFAAKQLVDPGADPSTILVRIVTSDVPLDAPAVELRWVGDDYGHGGSTGGRRMQHRSSSSEAWADA